MSMEYDLEARVREVDALIGKLKLLIATAERVQEVQQEREPRPMTVGDLRMAINGLRDDMPILVDVQGETVCMELVGAPLKGKAYGLDVRTLMLLARDPR